MAPVATLALAEGGDMSKTLHRTEDEASDHLHPWIYGTIVGLALLLILSVWGFLGRGYSGLVLAVVSAFIFIDVAIPIILWRIWRNHAADPDRPESFAAWLERDFEICDDRLKGADAALQVLLPIAAVSLGMAVFALVLHFDVGT
jgi:hypothetical protein